ncbi:MAG: PAS domain-containing protein, partial [Planctomycetota bacterium]
RNFLVQPEGRSTLDAIKLLPDSLRTVVSAGLHRAKSDDKPVVFHSVEISEDDDKNHRVTVEPYQKGSESMFLVSIEPEESPKVSVETPVQVQDFDSEAFSNERISQLERELGYTRETLQATVEELETSNEELQSTNEELIASNEELQSTNEELHSVNEELYTVNSEHKQKIEELTELTSDMDNLLKSTDIGTIFLDDEFRIRMFTPAISAAFNVMEQDIGRPIEHIAYKLDSPNLIEDAARVLRTGVPAEVEVQNYHGQCYLQRIQPYRTEFGEIKGIVLTTTNVTAVREAERAERQLDSVAQIQEELPEFAYAVSHDLQAPLRHITHYSRILEEKAESGAIDEVLRASKVISESTANLRTMIEGLLTYSRINTRGGPLLRVQLDDVIADAVLHLGSTISFHDADIDVPEMPVVVGDAEQLEQLFFHVIDNAIKYCDDSTTPEVKLSVTADNRQIHIIVSDNGIGIEERHRERVFTMFKRLGFKETVPGSGIGLAISRRIVVRHGGRIWFTGNDRGGSDCHILLQKYLRPDVDTALPSSGPIANRS